MLELRTKKNLRVMESDISEEDALNPAKKTHQSTQKLGVVRYIYIQGVSKKR
jgi:hypothetical protein